jgi:hypothetical protein
MARNSSRIDFGIVFFPPEIDESLWIFVSDSPKDRTSKKEIRGVLRRCLGAVSGHAMRMRESLAS